MQTPATAFPPEADDFNTAQVGAIAHLYRGEVYRSTMWRTRLDNTTNWAVVTTGIALSLTFSGPYASPLPMALVGAVVVVFLLFEARRYRYFNVWRARARLIETEFYAPLLDGKGIHIDSGWNDLLAKEYRQPEYHISLARAIGRRLRRNYAWILAIQVLAYYSKLAIHPSPILGYQDIIRRAAIGPIPGELVMVAGLLFHGGWIVFAMVTWNMDRKVRRARQSKVAMG